MHSSAASLITQEAVRAQFPGLQSEFVFLENAGGSQVPSVVIDAISGLMRESYVQIGCPYPHSARAGEIKARAHEFALELFNGRDQGRVVIGTSTTELMHRLAASFRLNIKPGDEVVVSNANHEANAGPWANLARDGVTVKFWRVQPDGTSSLPELAELITERTKIIAFPVTSNLLGDTMPVAEICAMAHRAGARAVVDAVAYASHAAIDAPAWGADFCVFSAYKVYGPHLAALYGSEEAWSGLQGPNHFFIPDSDVSGKFELGCLPYELLAGFNAVGDYLAFIAGSKEADRPAIESAFAQMKRMEMPFLREVLGFLNSRTDIRIIGPAQPAEDRHPTISFVHDQLPSSEIARRVCDQGFGIRSGHMYSYRLCEDLGLPTNEGVVRISAVHYNTAQEARGLIQALESVLAV